MFLFWFLSICHHRLAKHLNEFFKVFNLSPNDFIYIYIYKYIYIYIYIYFYNDDIQNIDN